MSADALLCGYVGDERTLAYYLKSVGDWRPVAVEQRSLEQDIEHRAALWRGDFRAAVPPARVTEFIHAAAPTSWIADPAFGIVLGEGDRATIERAAKSFGGTVAFVRNGWFAVDSIPQRELLERLKKAFDPDNRLVPLPW